MEINNKEEHLENFNMIMTALKDYLQQNFENKSIIDNFENFFDIDKIINKDNVTLLNLAKLLLLMTSLSSIKEKLLPLLISMDEDFQNEYILSCEFVQIKSAGMLLKNNFANNDSNIEVSEISFFLSGGDFLRKKIEILDETIIKNSEMYNSILNKMEKEMADLKQSKSDLENFNNEKAEQIKELKQKLDEELSQLIKKNEEIIQLQKALDEYKSKNDKDISQSQKQLKDLTDSKDQEILKLNNQLTSEHNKFNKQAENIKLMQEENEQLKQQLNNMNLLRQENENLKNQVENMNLLLQENNNLKNYYEEGEKEKGKMKNEISMCHEKINILEQKLNSDPYYAREIMSKTLYDFALKMMSENN